MRGFRKALGIWLLSGLILLSACGKQEPVYTIDFQEVSDTTEAPEETSRHITLSESDAPTIPTLDEEPFSPEMELKFYGNFGLIKEETRIGNLRDRPTTSGNIVGRFYSNTGMEILEVLDGWYRVSSGGLEGYVYQPLVKTGQEAVDQCLKYENYWVRIDTATLNVRMDPSTEAGILTRIKEGQNYRILEVLDGWYKISVGAEEGYVSAQYCRAGYSVSEAENWSQMDNITGTAKTVISYGMQLLGTPYVFSGETLSGLDCSGFTKLCMSQVGISLPRLAKEQATRGSAVGSIYDAVPGDLLFYNTKGQGIDHVAIYIGDSKILHAARSIGCVSISVYNYCGEPAAIRRFY